MSTQSEKKQELKELYFKNEKTFFSKRSKFISYTMKDTTHILSNIASNGRFTEIRSRYKVLKLLSTILLKSQFDWILYAYYRKNTLFLATKNHIGQSELNLQKLTLIQYFKQSKYYNDIQKVSVFRDESYINLKNEKKEVTSPRYKEQSYAIFSNTLSNDIHNKILEKIRKKIQKIQKKHI